MIRVDYNYHGHTYRCGHASNIEDEKYILEAVNCGYTKYGFSDHVSVSPFFYWDKSMRMHDRDVDNYLESVYSLKEKHKYFIDIYAGFEAEYDEVIEEYLCSLRDKCDYMILGQHYVLGKDIRICVDYPIQYAKKVCKAIESGIFDIVAHPDIFMKYRNQIEETKKEEYLVNCIEASKMICEKAFSYDIPLEINLGGFGGKGVDLNYLYPTQLFWDIVKEYRNKVVVGIDNHHKNDIYLAPLKLDVLSDKIDFDNLNIIRDFDPVVYRKNNNKLKVAYANTKSNLTSVESRLVDNIGNIDDLVVYLRKFPSHREFVNMYYDCITFFKREELIRVIKKCHDNDLVNSVDKYYSKNKVKQKIKER
jgi:histidinol-phosphatase (PHP family)